MNLFYIRSLAGIISAETIINQYIQSNKKNIALIIGGKLKYSKNLRDNLDNYKWVNVIDDHIFKSQAHKTIKNLVKIKKELNNFAFLLKSTGVKHLFLSRPHTLTERKMVLVAEFLNIKVSFYEEGARIYLNNLNVTVKNKIKHVMKYIYFTLFFSKYINNLYGDYNIFKEKDIYLFFGITNDNFINSNIKYIDFKSYHNLQKVSKFILESECIYISRPLSEDNIISFNDELNIMKHVLQTQDKCFIKFHPRDSVNKKNYIKKNLNFMSLPDYFTSYSAEELIINSNINIVIGTFSTTLHLLTFFDNIKIISYATVINSNEKEVNDLLKLTIKNFNNKIIFKSY